MMLMRDCPRCSTRVNYLSEQVGAQHTCQRCGQQFELVANPVRTMLFLGAATVGACCVGGGYLGLRLLLRLAAREARRK